MHIQMQKKNCRYDDGSIEKQTTWFRSGFIPVRPLPFQFLRKSSNLPRGQKLTKKSLTLNELQMKVDENFNLPEKNLNAGLLYVHEMSSLE